MPDLLLAILSTTGIAVLLRLARQHQCNTEAVIATNYVVAAFVGWSLLYRSASPVSAGPVTAALGLGGGLLWPLSFLLYSWVIARHGIALAGAWSRLSVGVPVLFGVAVLGEATDPRLFAGLVLLGAAIAALTPAAVPVTQGSVPEPAWSATLSGPRRGLVHAAALIVAFGVIDAWISLFNAVGGGDDHVVFFVLLFTSAAVVSWAALLLRRQPVRWADVTAGPVLGLLNFAVSWFLLRAISGTFEQSTATAYSLFSATSMVLMMVIGRIAWNERFRSRDQIGIVVALGAIVVLNR